MVYMLLFYAGSSPSCQKLFQDWISYGTYSEHAKTIQSAFSGKIHKEEVVLSALGYTIEHSHKEVHNLFLELAREFAIPVGEQYEYTTKRNN